MHTQKISKPSDDLSLIKKLETHIDQTNPNKTLSLPLTDRVAYASILPTLLRSHFEIKELKVSSTGTSDHIREYLDVIPGLLNRYPGIKTLTIRNAKFTTNDTKDLKTLEAIAHLNIHTLVMFNCQLDDSAAEILAKNDRITDLKLSSNNITDVGALKIAEMFSLKNLTITNNKITNNGIVALAKNKDIVQLFIHGNPYTPDVYPSLVSRSLLRTDIEAEYKKLKAIDPSMKLNETSALKELSNCIKGTSLDLSNGNTNFVRGLSLEHIEAIPVFFEKHAEIKELRIRNFSFNGRPDLESENARLALITSFKPALNSESELKEFTDKLKNLDTKFCNDMPLLERIAELKITTLIMPFCNLGNKAAKVLAKNPNLLSFDFSNNKVGPNTTKKINDILKERNDKTLKEITIKKTDNQIKPNSSSSDLQKPTVIISQAPIKTLPEKLSQLEKLRPSLEQCLHVEKMCQAITDTIKTTIIDDKKPPFKLRFLGGSKYKKDAKTTVTLPAKMITLLDIIQKATTEELKEDHETIDTTRWNETLQNIIVTGQKFYAKTRKDPLRKKFYSLFLPENREKFYSEFKVSKEDFLLIEEQGIVKALKK